MRRCFWSGLTSHQMILVFREQFSLQSVHGWMTGIGGGLIDLALSDDEYGSLELYFMLSVDMIGVILELVCCNERLVI